METNRRPLGERVDLMQPPPKGALLNEGEVSPVFPNRGTRSPKETGRGEHD
jgi:hypothetical protein